MSQTETILLVVLGFSLASLIALFIGRMMWSMAVRIGARRMQRQVPSSVVGLQTERDRLRAEYAMLAQRMATRIDAMKLTMAEHMAEVSRHRNRLEHSEKEAALRGQEAQALREENAKLAQQLQQANDVEAELRALLVSSGSSPQIVRPPVMPAPVEEPVKPAAPVEDETERLRQRIERLNRMASAVARDRASVGLPETIILPPPPPPADPLVVEKLKEAERETDDLSRELERLDAEWSRRLEQENATPQAETAVEPAEPQPDGAAPKDETSPNEASSNMAVANVISLANRIRDLRKGLHKP